MHLLENRAKFLETIPRHLCYRKFGENSLRRVRLRRKFGRFALVSLQKLRFCFTLTGAMRQKGYSYFLSPFVTQHAIAARYSVATLCRTN